MAQFEIVIRSTHIAIVAVRCIFGPRPLPAPHHATQPTTALVLEIVSPSDETLEKLPFRAARRVNEVLIVDPTERAVHWLALAEEDYRQVERSGLIDLEARELADRIDWPAADSSRPQ